MSEHAAKTEREGDATLASYADILIGVAESSIDHGLVHGAPLPVDPDAHPPALREHRATFVTLLDRSGALRGCIGTLEAHRPLVVDVAVNAYAAGFEDPRFPPLTQAERAAIACKLSVLTAPEPMAFDDEADLVAQLEPGVDGVLIEAGRRRATLLPQVWDHILDPSEFWRTVKTKAGLAPDECPAELKVYRYRAQSLG